MSTEKLSEISNPAWIVGQQEIADFMRGDEALLVRGYDPESTEPALRMYSQEYVSALLARIAELEAISADASQVFNEIGNELGCNPDNESIMMAIDDLKATQMTGPLKDVLKRNIELEAKLATPVRLPDIEFVKISGIDFPVMRADIVKKEIRRAGFTVEGDEQDD
ncbi:hypothetical protein IHE77_13960 [Serratia ureilytica]|uniref:hypothetical protein n=1 Tax=Serratia ureilytica TaxID=300181 RepID=UPI001F4CF347|nr:hypothetical protein [Serratia ureilytica]UNE41988.1 hypothetical protein IHE77_13960 [Serratia ureilytica]